MQTSEQWLNYQKLEQIATPPERWQWRIRDYLRASHRDEPRVWQQRGGFRVYDPLSGTSAQLASEQDVRIWLEQRYYR